MGVRLSDEVKNKRKLSECNFESCMVFDGDRGLIRWLGNKETMPPKRHAHKIYQSIISGKSGCERHNI